MVLRSDFGKRLQLIRVSRDMDQREMAELLCVTQGTISYWERNVWEPTTLQVKRYAEILGVPFEWLCGWGEDFSFEISYKGNE